VINEAPNGSASGLAALAEPSRRVGPRLTSALALANLGIMTGFFTPLQVLLPLQVEAIDPAHKVANLSLVAGVGAFVSMVANPLAGALSDRTTAPSGRRRPWVFLASFAAAVVLLLLSRAPSLALIAVGWALAQLTLNASYAAVTAVIPDQVPHAQRATVSAFVGVAQPLGIVLGVGVVVALVSGQQARYAAVAGLVLVTGLVMVAMVREPRLPPAAVPAFAWRDFVGRFWISPRRHPDFAWAWFTRFLVMLGQALSIGYLLYFLQDAVEYERIFPGKTADDGVAFLIVLYTLALLLTAIPGGMASDRLGRRKVFVITSALVSSLGGLLLFVNQSWPAVVAAAVVFGLGFGVYTAVDIALVTEVLPAAEDRARDLGVINVANALPQVLAPVLAAPIISVLGGYPSLYLTSALVTVAGGLLVVKIRGVR